MSSQYNMENNKSMVNLGDDEGIWKVKASLTPLGMKRVGGFGPGAHFIIPAEKHHEALAIIAAGVENRPTCKFGGSYGDGD